MTSPIEAALADDDVAIEVLAAQGTAALGRVIGAGARATTLVGKDVLVGPIDPCGECEVCRRGGAPVCPSARRRNGVGAQVVAASRWVVPLEAGLDLPRPAAAAVAGDVALAYTLYARTGVGPREPVVVTGASPVTRFLLDVLVAKGIAPVVVADPAHPAHAAWSAHLAGKGLAHAAPADARERATEVFAAQGLGARPWRVIATTAATVPLAAALAGPRATLTVLAPIAGLPGELADREVTVIAVAGAHPDLVVEVAAMCAKGELDLAGGTSSSDNAELRAVVAPRA